MHSLGRARELWEDPGLEASRRHILEAFSTSLL